MGEFKEILAADGHPLDCYVARPAGPPRGALVVIQEIFGLNSHIQSVCDSYASEGHLCVAPALFDRVAKKIEFGYGPDDYTQAMATRSKLTWEGALNDVAAAHEVAAEVGRVGVLGYCYGGSVAYLAAVRQSFACAISYYGGAVAGFSSEKPQCPTICHFGDSDRAIPLEKIEEIRVNRPEMTVYVYKGAGHGFNCDQRESWDAEAAALARRRTLNHLRRFVG